MLRIKNYKFYNTQIDDLIIPDGDIVNVTGVAGAGKTTFLNWIYNMLTGQEIIPNGCIVSKYSFDEIMFFNGIADDDITLDTHASMFAGQKVLLFEIEECPVANLVKILSWISYFSGLKNKPTIIFSTQGVKIDYPGIKVVKLCQ